MSSSGWVRTRPAANESESMIVSDDEIVPASEYSESSDEGSAVSSDESDGESKFNDSDDSTRRFGGGRLRRARNSSDEVSPHVPSSPGRIDKAFQDYQYKPDSSSSAPSRSGGSNTAGQESSGYRNDRSGRSIRYSFVSPAVSTPSSSDATCEDVVGVNVMMDCLDVSSKLTKGLLEAFAGPEPSHMGEPGSAESPNVTEERRALLDNLKVKVTGGRTWVSKCPGAVELGAVIRRVCPPVTNSAGVSLELKEYQLAGVLWLLTLHRQNVFGILADEMGLGKTAQTIIFLRYLYRTGTIDAPSIVACPATLVDNWLNELRRWAPDLRTIKYHGDQKVRRCLIREFELAQKEAGATARVNGLAVSPDIDDDESESDEDNNDDDPDASGVQESEEESPASNVGGPVRIVVASVQAMSSSWDRSLFFKKHQFAYLVVDEAHNLKNAESQLHRHIKRNIAVERRLLLTGSPIQNEVQELQNLTLLLLPWLDNEKLQRAIESYTKHRSKADDAQRKATVETSASTTASTCGSPEKASLTESSDGFNPTNLRVEELGRTLDILPLGEVSSAESTTVQTPSVDLPTPSIAPSILELGATLDSSAPSSDDSGGKDSNAVAIPNNSSSKSASHELNHAKANPPSVTNPPSVNLDLQSQGRGLESRSAAESPTKRLDPQIEFLQLILAPFILRRLKSEVISDLPEKISIVERCTMDGPQRVMYLKVLSETADSGLARDLSGLALNLDMKAPLDEGPSVPQKETKTANESETSKKIRKPKGIPRLKKQYLHNIVFRLRRVCNHPILFKGRYKDSEVDRVIRFCMKHVEGFKTAGYDKVKKEVESWCDYDVHQLASEWPDSVIGPLRIPPAEFVDRSTKIRRMLELVDSVTSRQDSKALIFSQFTTFLDVISETLRLHRPQLKFFRLDGATVIGERQFLVDQFAVDNSVKLFLLSTKAGGVGLNLTAADTVILMDQDWNPHNDRQAEDRVHRLGQTRTVTVHRLCCKGTIEESILKCAKRKLHLDEAFGGNADLLSAAILKDCFTSSLIAHNSPGGSPGAAAASPRKSLKSSEGNIPRKKGSGDAPEKKKTFIGSGIRVMNRSSDSNSSPKKGSASAVKKAGKVSEKRENPKTPSSSLKSRPKKVPDYGGDGKSVNKTPRSKLAIINKEVHDENEAGNDTVKPRTSAARNAAHKGTIPKTSAKTNGSPPSLQTRKSNAKKLDSPSTRSKATDTNKKDDSSGGKRRRRSSSDATPEGRPSTVTKRGKRT